MLADSMTDHEALIARFADYVASHASDEDFVKLIPSARGTPGTTLFGVDFRVWMMVLSLAEAVRVTHIESRPVLRRRELEWAL